MKRRSITIFLFPFFVSIGYTQTVQRFQYVKLYNVGGTCWQLVNGSNITTLSRYEKIEGQRQRTISGPEGQYTIIVSKAEKKALLKNELNETVATFPYRGAKAMDVTLPDGTYYQWKKNGANQWKYLSGDQEVLVCRFKREGGKRFLEYEIKDPQAKGLELIMLASHDLGIGVIVNKANTPIILGTAAALALIRAATYEAPAVNVQ